MLRVIKRLLWLIPLALILILVAAILALPSFVASTTHRANIEALASSLTGRQVHIGGKLSLALLPAPEIIASYVTITSPDHETIKARSLTLDISLAALLHGQISAQNLTLDAPDIVFPWPLPGGARAIAPPGWLAALHARINKGTISLGAAQISAVNADIFTGANGTVSVSGTGNLMGHNISLSAALGAVQLTGAAPLTLKASSNNVSLNFSGGLSGDSILTGDLSFKLPQISGTTNITADGAAVTATALQLSAAKASITGTASLDFLHPKITANLNVQNFDSATLQTLPAWPDLPVALTLTATNVLLGGQTIPALQTNLDISAGAIAVNSLELTLPGSSAFVAHLGIAASGAITGQASLASPDLPGLLGSYGITPPQGWTSAQLAAQLSGTRSQLGLQNLSGAIGQNHVSGNLVITGSHVTGALNFSHLDLSPLLSWFGHPTAGFTADGEITADTATLGPIALKHLLLDAAFGHQINIRRISANLYDGMAAGSITLDDKGQVTAAHGFIAIPSAAPLAALLPANWQPPAALVQPRLNLAIFARGSPAALATSLVATLGDFTLTAAPVINLTAQTAAGPLSLRHPDAIRAFTIFGMNRGLAWPGAGSISLRADFTASPTQIGLPDFVLSMGDLTANGSLIRTNGTISGQIDAGTLALPPVPATWQIPWSSLTNIQGKIGISANRVLYAGNTILGGSLGSLTLAPDALTFNLTHAALAGGNLAGSLTATASAAAAPALTTKFSADHIDPSALNLPLAFPITLPSGTLAAAGNLTATGYDPKVWLATLSGTASLTGTNGTISGFSLSGLKAALKSAPRTKKLRSALATGTSNYATIALAAILDHGNCTLTKASLSGPDGTATASGSIDLFDKDVALQLALQPNVTPPLSVSTAILGHWAAPKRFPKLSPALSWVPAK